MLLLYNRRRKEAKMEILDYTPPARFGVSMKCLPALVSVRFRCPCDSRGTGAAFHRNPIKPGVLSDSRSEPNLECTGREGKTRIPGNTRNSTGEPDLPKRRPWERSPGHRKPQKETRALNWTTRGKLACPVIFPKFAEVMLVFGLEKLTRLKTLMAST